MRRRSVGAAIWVLVLVLLAGAGGGAAFLISRDEEQPEPTTTTTTTTPREAYLTAIAEALEADLPVAVGEEGAACIAGALLDVLGPPRLEALVGQPDPLGALTDPERAAVLRLVVTCVDPVVAEALLGGGTTTTRPDIGLPDEGG